MKLTQITNPVALRLDTTVGTRVFAGDTMIHGDTGWRDISGYMVAPVAAGARVYIRRTGMHVYLSADVLRFDETVHGGVPFLAIPAGFRAIKTYRTSGAYEAGAIYGQLGGTQLAFREEQTGSSRFYISYLTDDPWPTTLPGLPA